MSKHPKASDVYGKPIPMPFIKWEWKRWFAWYPVKLMDTKRWIWMRKCYRRKCWFIFTFYEHVLKNKHEDHKI